MARRDVDIDDEATLIRYMQAPGASLRKIAAELNTKGVATARGGKWAAEQVAAILRRTA